jgi:hypothetical protein
MSIGNRKIDKKTDEITINFVADTDFQPVQIENENTMFYDNLLQKKLILTYLQADNTAIPLFIPTKLNAFPSYAPASDVIYPLSNAIGVNSIDYVVGYTNNPANLPSVWGITQWTQTNPNFQVPSTLLGQKEVIQNKYYYSFIFEEFLKMLENTFNGVVVGGPPTPPTIQFIFTGSQITLFVPDAIQNFVGNFCINKALNDLLAFNSYQIQQGTDVYLLIPSGTKNYNGVQGYVYNSRYISRDWIPFDTILISSDIPLKTKEYVINNSGTNINSIAYKNIIFALNVLEDSINFYPYYIYEPSTTDMYKLFALNSFDATSYRLNLFLYNKKTNLTLPYVLRKGELVSLNFMFRDKDKNEV